MKFWSEVTSPHTKMMVQNHFRCAGAQCHLLSRSMIWCEAVSSRQVPLREPKWSLGNFNQNTIQNDPFRGHQLHDEVLGHQSELLEN